MPIDSEDVIYLFHKTSINLTEKIAKEGLKVSTPQNPTEQIIEYYRQKYYPNKPNRMNSIFFITTLSTAFKTDMSFFGELSILLGIKFTPETIKFFKFYEYNHLILMEIWDNIRRRIHEWYPNIWESSVILNANEIEILIDDYYTRILLDEFWNGFKGEKRIGIEYDITGVIEWDYKYKDKRALYCHQPITPDLIVYMIDIQQLIYKKKYPHKRIKY